MHVTVSNPPQKNPPFALRCVLLLDEPARFRLPFRFFVSLFVSRSGVGDKYLADIPRARQKPQIFCGTKIFGAFNGA